MHPKPAGDASPLGSLPPIAGSGAKALGRPAPARLHLSEIDMTRPREDRFDELFPGSTFTPEECEFLRAIDRYKGETGRNFLSWHEVLRLVKQLGYRQVLPPRPPVSPRVKKKPQQRFRTKSHRGFSSNSRY